MEREIIELRKQIATANSGPGTYPQQPQLAAGQVTPKQESNQVSPAGVYQTPSALSTDQYMGSQEAVASLLDLRSGFDGSNYMRNGNHQFKRIEDVMVVPEKVTELFNLYVPASSDMTNRAVGSNSNRFFTYYHPFLPFLNRTQTPDDYYTASPLLFWTIISVGARRYQSDSGLLTSLAGPVTRLVWSTLADIPQSYHVVKALCLLCSWPFPTSSTSTDPTFMLCGMMIQVAMQLGLHRPSHSQDFSKFRVELIEEELRDKVQTWAICNIVAQRYCPLMIYLHLSAILIFLLVYQLVMANPPLHFTTGHCRVIHWTPTSSCLQTLGLGWRLRSSVIKSPKLFTATGVTLSALLRTRRDTRCSLSFRVILTSLRNN
jgi:hypothetical protein